MALTLESLVLEFGKALAPIGQRLRGGQVALLFAELGLPAPGPVLGAERVSAAIRAAADALAALPAVLSDLAGAITSGDAAAIARAGARAAPLVQDVTAAVDAVGAEVNAAAALAGPGRAEVEAFAAELAARLFGYAVASYLDRERPVVGHLFTLVGLIEISAHAATPAAPAHVRRVLRFDRFGSLMHDPVGVLAQVYGWGTAAFDWDTLLARLSVFLGRVSNFAFVEPGPPPVLRVAVIDVGATDDAVPGVQAVLRVAARQGLDAVRPVGDTVALTVKAEGGLETGAAVALLPPADLRVVPPSAEARGTLRVGVQAPHATAAPPVVILGVGGGARVEARRVRLGLGADLTWDPLRRRGNGAFMVEGALEGGKIVLDPAGADGFVAALLPGGPLELDADLLVRWSSATGLHFDGEAGLHTTYTLHRSLGPFRLESVEVAFAASADALTGTVAVTGSATLGPVTASVASLGTTVALRFQRGNLGPVDLAVGFKPPDGVGLSVEAQGVVTGGGFLFHDGTHQLYAGSMQLSLNETITLSAFGLIATQMPDGSRGYSLIIFITAEDFEPIPLGLGFVLEGIGGMVAVNRTFDQDVLRAGLQNDTLKALLFPRDPVANAPAIIRSLASAFPAQHGCYLLGILAKIGWFTPTLIELDLALILEFGARERLLVLGRISSLLPSADNDLVRINLDAIGVLDFDQDTAAIDAVLVDSRLVHKFALTGAAALRAGWGSAESTDFVLSIGGFNPRFAPPAGVPPLARVQIALSSGTNPRLTCDAYFAITSNTIQFGAEAQLYAEAYGFSISGDVGYDVLIARAPLHFIADFHASVQLKHGSDNLFKVSVEGELEGPQPLRLSGKASFEIFWCDFSVRFDTTLIQGEPPPLPPAVDVLAQLEAALSTPQSWSTQLAPNRTHGVALRKLAPGSELVLDPLGRLAVNESVVPLDTGRDIDSFGGAPVAGARRFALSVALNGVALTERQALQARFAPAQFFAMSDDEELASPSFETMDSGLVVGTDAVSFDTGQLVAAPVEYQAITVDPLAATAPPPGSYTLPAVLLRLHSAGGAAGRAPARRLGRARFRSAAPRAVSLAQPSWAIVPLDAGTPVALDPSIKTWTDYRAALATLNRGGAGFQLVPARDIAA